MNVQARAIGPAKNEYSFREGESTIVLLSKKRIDYSFCHPRGSCLFFYRSLFCVSIRPDFSSGKIPYPECFKVARLSAGLPSLID